MIAFIGKQTAALFVLIVLGAGLAQTWSGTVTGLPIEAAGIGLYVLDFEALMKGQSSSEGVDFGDVYQKIGPGSLSRDGSFTVGAAFAAVQRPGAALPLTRALTLLDFTGTENLSLVPEDAQVLVVAFEVENRRGERIGSVIPEDEGRFTIWPTLLFTHVPVRIEGSVWNPNFERKTAYDTLFSPGFNLLGVSVGLNFLNPRLKVRAISESPRQWVYQNN